MKNLRFFYTAFLTLAIFAFTNCKERDQEAQEEPTISIVEEPITSFRKGLTSLNKDDQNIIFDQLPNEIKSALWKDRINEALSWSFNREQKRQLEEFRDQLSAKSYDTLVNTSFKEYTKKWYEQAMLAFTEQDSILFANALFQLGAENNVLPILQQQIPLCNCEFNAWLQCPPWMDCKLILCRRTPCGIANLWKCNAMCD